LKPEELRNQQVVLLGGSQQSGTESEACSCVAQHVLELGKPLTRLDFHRIDEAVPLRHDAACH
jgi:hypothetical protein